MTKPMVIKKGLRLNQFLEERMFLVVASGLILGAVFHKQMILLKPAIPYMFAYITLVMALGCSTRDFKNALKSPALILWMLSLLHIVMPVLAVLLARFFLQEPLLQAGLIIGTATPIGVSSVIWVGISGGNIALALTTVIADTILSPVIVPLILLLTMGQTVHFNLPQLMIGLTWMIVIPTIIGMIGHDLSNGNASRAWRFFNGPATKILMAMVIATNLAVAWNSLHLFKSALPVIVILVFVMGCGGYLLGFLTAKLAKLSPANTNTFIFTVGMRNITAGLVMALQYFAELTAIPVVFAILFQQPLAVISHRVLIIKEKPGSILTKPLMKPHQK